VLAVDPLPAVDDFVFHEGHVGRRAAEGGEAEAKEQLRHLCEAGFRFVLRRVRAILSHAPQATRTCKDPRHCGPRHRRGMIPQQLPGPGMTRRTFVILLAVALIAWAVTLAGWSVTRNDNPLTIFHLAVSGDRWWCRSITLHNERLILTRHHSNVPMTDVQLEPLFREAKAAQAELDARRVADRVVDHQSALNVFVRIDRIREQRNALAAEQRVEPGFGSTRSTNTLTLRGLRDDAISVRNVLSVAIDRSDPGVSPAYFRITSSLWLPALLATMAALVAGATDLLVRKKRRRAGCCALCGYDLRASPTLCPECGHPQKT
jgi:hypothetical protein